MVAVRWNDNYVVYGVYVQSSITQWSRQHTGSQYKCVEYLLHAGAPFWFMNKFIKYISVWTSLFATLVTLDALALLRRYPVHIRTNL